MNQLINLVNIFKFRYSTVSITANYFKLSELAEI